MNKASSMQNHTATTKEDIFHTCGLSNPSSPIETFSTHPLFSDSMDLLHVLYHVSLTHPALRPDAITSRVTTLERRRMIFLQVQPQKLVSLKPIHQDSVTALILANIW
jgi:hypothetical protein